MKPLSDLSIQAWARLVRAQNKVLAAVEADLKRAGLPPLSWYDVLLELNREPDTGLRPYELEEMVLLAQYNMSRLIGRLEASGYVARQPAPDDGRGQIVTITQAGRELLKKMWPAYANAIRRHFASRLDETETAALSGALDKLLEPPPE